MIADVSIGKVIGGAERVLFEQSSRLARRGHSVCVLTRGMGNVTNTMIQGVREFGYGVNRANALAFVTTTFANGKRVFESLHREYGFDRMLVHQPFSALGPVSSHLATGIRKTYICHSLSFEEYVSRNPMPESIPQKVAHALNVGFRKAMERRLLGKAESIVVLSDFTKRKLTEKHHIGQDKIVRIPGGTDLVKFSPASPVERESIRREFGIRPNDIVLFTVRNLVPRMGLENLLRAMKIIADHTSNIRLIIGGDGPLKEKLATLSKMLEIDGQIVLKGFIPEDRLPDYYKCADIFILPTRELEGFGLVTTEALASGLPVLGTPVGGTLEILGGLDKSLLFDGSGPDAIAKLVLEKSEIIRKFPETWNELREVCRKYAETRYSWETHVDVLEKFVSLVSRQ